MWWPDRRSSVTPFRWSLALAIDRLNTVAVQHFSWIIYLSMTKRCVFVIAFYQNAFHCLWNADNLLIGVTTHRQTTPIAVMALPRRRYVPRSQAFSLSLCRGSDPGSAHKPRRRRETAPVPGLPGPVEAEARSSGAAVARPRGAGRRGDADSRVSGSVAAGATRRDRAGIRPSSSACYSATSISSLAVRSRARASSTGPTWTTLNTRPWPPRDSSCCVVLQT